MEKLYFFVLRKEIFVVFRTLKNMIFCVACGMQLVVSLSCHGGEISSFFHSKYKISSFEFSRFKYSEMKIFLCIGKFIF